MALRVRVLWSPPMAVVTDELRESWLDDVEQHRLDRLTRPDAQRELVTARMLVKSLVAQLAAVPPADVRLGYTCARCGEPHGRPVVTQPHEASAVQVSLAHAAGRVVAAAVVGAAVGIDVEPVPAQRFDPSGDLDRVAFAPAEIDRIRARPRPERDRARVSAWVRKEAWLKAEGHGLRVDPSTVDVEHAPARFSDLDLGPGYAAAVAVLTRARITVRLDRLSAPSAGSADRSRAASAPGAP